MKRKRPPIWAIALGIGGLLAVILGLWFRAATRPREFEFLKAAEEPLSWNQPPCLGSVHNIQKPFLQVRSEARAELLSQGYIAWDSKNGDSATLVEKPMYPEYSINISRGKALRMVGEGHSRYPEIDDDPGWSVVNITRTDPVPMWLREYIGY